MDPDVPWEMAKIIYKEIKIFLKPIPQEWNT
jgi:hypothetical protein